MPDESTSTDKTLPNASHAITEGIPPVASESQPGDGVAASRKSEREAETRPTGCPVPREASDNEKILKWLGFVPHELEEGCENPELWRRDKEMLYGRKHPDVRLDYLVLEKVRTLDGASQATFANNLQRLWCSRNRASGWFIEYLPGDYAEAARFLWEGE